MKEYKHCLLFANICIRSRREIFVCQNYVKYANDITDDVILNPILYEAHQESYHGQFASQTIETWQVLKETHQQL